MNSLHSLEKTTNQDNNSTIFLPKHLCDEMPFKIATFQKQQGKWITPHCQYIQDGDVHYYGIHKSQQMSPPVNSESLLSTRQLYQEMKSHILQNMQLQTDTPVIQVVGDSSASFSQEGTKRAKEFLREQLTENSLVSYGYTGLTENDGTRCVNASVSDVILEKNMQGRVVANLVGFHTGFHLFWGVFYHSFRPSGRVFSQSLIASICPGSLFIAI